MGIGASIFLIAIGLILAFAVHVSISGLDVQLIGIILAGVGVLGLILSFTIWSPRRRTVTSSRVVHDPLAPGSPVVEERRTYDDGTPRYPQP